MAVKMNPFIFYLIFVAFIGGDASHTSHTVCTAPVGPVQRELDYRTCVVGAVEAFRDHYLKQNDYKIKQKTFYQHLFKETS